MKDGGPAFPVQYSNEADGPTVMPTEGMSLRDWFAGQALAGWLAGLPANSYAPPEGTAKQVYEYADAMFKAREES